MAINPDPVDIHVGSRVRLRRTLMGFSQVKLAQMLGLTFQQVQKYEKGHNRMGSSRLFQISRLLDVPISFFFDEMRPAAVAMPGVAEPPQATYEVDTMARRETLELVRAYYRITDPDQRRRVYELVKSMGPPAAPR